MDSSDTKFLVPEEVSSQAATLAMLRAARARIDSPSKWTRFSFARNSAGKGVPVQAQTAVRWCAIGALRGGEESYHYAQQFLTQAVIQITANPFLTVPEFNDTRKHVEVLAMYDLAIQLAERE